MIPTIQGPGVAVSTQGFKPCNLGSIVGGICFFPLVFIESQSGRTMSEGQPKEAPVEHDIAHIFRPWISYYDIVLTLSFSR